MIQTFADKDTERLFGGRRVKKYGPDLSDRALQKLLMLNAANGINDLRMDQYRIGFTWTVNGPHGVEIVDYH